MCKPLKQPGATQITEKMKMQPAHLTIYLPFMRSFSAPGRLTQRKVRLKSAVLPVNQVEGEKVYFWEYN